MASFTSDFLEDILNHMSGSSTPVLEVTHVAFTTKFDTPGVTDDFTTDTLEIGRVTATNVQNVTNLYTSFVLGYSDCNCATTTITLAGVNNTTFTVSDASSFNIGDRIEIEMGIANGGTVDRKITNISGNVITISETLPGTPATGENVNQKISRMALVANGTGTALSGTVVSWQPYILYKTSSIRRTGTFTIR